MKRYGNDQSTIFMNATVVGRVAKNKLEELRVSVLKNNKIDLRIYFYFPNEPEPKPTRKGIWLSFKHVPQIITAFEKYVKDPKNEFAIDYEINLKEHIRVYVNEYLGSKVVHIRTFFLKDNEFAPGKGISFAVSLLPQVLDVFKQLEKHKAE